jgi:hypothetical protein
VENGELMAQGKDLSLKFRPIAQTGAKGRQEG